TITHHLIKIIQQYTINNLSQNINHLPNKQTHFTKTINTTKTNLHTINTQIHNLTNTTTLNNFNQHNNIIHFNHNFHNII
ncbi:hypothetical protein GUF79_16855, partial [Xanthomonas citri pv. citri]|nr:hypothetical protein [Xanthomonas citri pv. citri]